MKKRLPRKVKKALYTEARLMDKKYGYKMKRSAMRMYMYHLYLKKMYTFGTNSYGCYAQFFNYAHASKRKVLRDL